VKVLLIFLIFLGQQKYNTVIAENTVVKGSIVSDSSICIAGKVEGDVFSKDVILISKTGKVTSTNKIYAKDIIVEGQLKGNIECENKIILRSTAHVIGDIICKVLVIEEGAFFEGNCKMTTEPRDTLGGK